MPNEGQEQGGNGRETLSRIMTNIQSQVKLRQLGNILQKTHLASCKACLRYEASEKGEMHIQNKSIPSILAGQRLDF